MCRGIPSAVVERLLLLRLSIQECAEVPLDGAQEPLAALLPFHTVHGQLRESQNHHAIEIKLPGLAHDIEAFEPATQRALLLTWQLIHDGWNGHRNQAGHMERNEPQQSQIHSHDL
jgi:hypothetical protein